MRFTVKQARQFAGFTQQKMADSLEIDRKTYGKIEKDPQRATVRQVCRISELTGIPVSDIFLGFDSTNVDVKPPKAG